MNYSDYVATIANLTVIESTDPDFVQILPEAIEYSENRIYRELDLLSTVARDTGTVTANQRRFTLPQNVGRFVVTNGINIFTPAGTTQTRTQLTPVSRDYIDAAWPTDTAATSTTVPSSYAMLTDQTVIFGPPPGASYIAEVIGTVQASALSSSNTTTVLSTYFPDLMVAATMVFMSGYMRNFGSQADDPKMAQSWETQYQTLFSSANVVENRKKYASGAWGSLQPTPIATPNR